MSTKNIKFLSRYVIVCTTILFSNFSFCSPQTSNWCHEAERSLTDKDGNSINCSSVSKRCVRINNYWCQKHGSIPWRGTATTNGKDGNSDADGHAIFESAEWSSRAIAIDLRAKYRRGLITAVQIASAHSPWCDTLGSKDVVNGRGRTCPDGRASPPSGFKGPFCERPKKNNPETSDCATGCNCPPYIAKKITEGLNIGINDDLNLFNQEGQPQPNLVTVIRNLAIQEQGIFVKPNIIEDGIRKLTY